MLYQNRVWLMVPFVKTKGTAASEDSEGKLNKDAYESREYRSFQEMLEIIRDKENRLRDALMNAQDISPKTKEKLLDPLIRFTLGYGEYNKTHDPWVLHAARRCGGAINEIWQYAEPPERAAIVRVLHEIEPLVPELVREALKGIPERYIQQREELSTLRRSELRKAFLSAFRKVDSGIKEVELFLADRDKAFELSVGTMFVDALLAIPIWEILADQHIITQELFIHGLYVLTAIFLGTPIISPFIIGGAEKLKDAWENETICW